MKIDEVIKIGGSLLAEPGAMRLVRDWLEATRQEDATRLLLAGGGPVVEGLRVIDAANQLSQEASHWAAIRLMDANTRLLGEWFPGTQVFESLELMTPGDNAFLCHNWLLNKEPQAQGERLAVGWSITSDSIAARIATVLDARLTVLKHTVKTTYRSPVEAASAGVVDREFPRHMADGARFRLIGVVSPGWDAAG